MVFEWRVNRPLELSKSREWNFLLPSRSQSLAGLPERFGQLSISIVIQLPPSGQPSWVLAQLMFTFPSQGNVTGQADRTLAFPTKPCLLK